MTFIRSRGFTLMEMVITLTMLALMAAYSAPYLTYGVQSYHETAAAVDTLTQLRLSSERLVREIREIRNSGAYDISTPVSGPNSTLSFTKSDTETVTIDTAAGALRLSYASVSGGSAFTLSNKLSSITFRYWQNDGVTAATSNSDVAFIDFELVLTHSGNSYPQRSRVALRNQP